MNWSNQGTSNGVPDPNTTWDVEHIVPVSMGKTEQEIIILNHYLNLRPYCTYKNKYVKKDIPPRSEEIERILTSILYAKQKKIIDDMFEKYSQATDIDVRNIN